MKCTKDTYIQCATVNIVDKAITSPWRRERNRTPHPSHPEKLHNAPLNVPASHYDPVALSETTNNAELMQYGLFMPSGFFSLSSLQPIVLSFFLYPSLLFLSLTLDSCSCSSLSIPLSLHSLTPPFSAHSSCS
ncbi:hypothetical protein NL108_015035 [Boleophthalmus pectinirostris]|nr:hypothetical protein NL108_015035 [Boleophthalmus pectinirostris]